MTKNLPSKTFCILPWIHLATRPNGDVRLCCTSNASAASSAAEDRNIGLVKSDSGNPGNLATDSLWSVWNNDFMRTTRQQILAGEVPNSCQKCFREEQQGIVSKRQWENQEWAKRIDIQEIVDQTSSDGSIPNKIYYFDLRLGNTCNLRCVMCSPHDSSKWVNDWRKIHPKMKNAELKSNWHWNESWNYRWYENDDFKQALFESLKYTKELYFAGGEPLLIKEHQEILSMCVELGYAKDIILRYNSNGTLISDELISLWEQFKLVKFNFSIDAYGERNDYIRRDSHWQQIESTLERLDSTPNSIVVNVACAIQALNITCLPAFCQWKIERNFRKINAMPYGAGIIGTHLVYLPSYMNIRVLPPKYKSLVRSEFETFYKWISVNMDWDNFASHPYGLQRWNGILDWMEAEDWSHKLPQLKEYLEHIDQIRDDSLSFSQCFPELLGIFDGI